MAGIDKTFAPVMGIPLVSHTLHRFQLSPRVHQVVLVLAKDSLVQGRRLVQDGNYSKVTDVCVGGRRRQDSVRLGLDLLSACDWVIVHDGARPCFDDAMLQRGLEAATQCGSAVAGMPVKDTIKLVSPNQLVEETPERSRLWAAQTPQVFRRQLLIDAYNQATDEVATDEAQLVEQLGHPVSVIPGWPMNFKITTADDFTMAQAVLDSLPKKSLRSLHPFADERPGFLED